MYGHQNAATLPDGFPQYFTRAEGCRLWDSDGNEYIDYVCGFGTNLLGYRHPEVERSAAIQAANGDCMTGPGPAMVELANVLSNWSNTRRGFSFARTGPMRQPGASPSREPTPGSAKC